MKKNHQKELKILKKIKWFLVCAFLILPCLLNYYFNNINFFIRSFIISFLIFCAIKTFFSTKQGRHFFWYIKSSKQETKKIIWPKYKDTLYTTLIIIFITIIMSFLLWILDSIIFRIIAFTINLRF